MNGNDPSGGMRLPRHWSFSETITDRMPLLDAWLERAAQHRPLERCTVLLLQHQLGNHVPQARALLALGVRPERMHWIDIPYTRRAPVQRAVQAMGVPAANFAPGNYRVLDDYAPYMRSRVQRFIARMLTDPPEHLLVLDDGAYFLDALAHGDFGALPRLSIVEQTTRGIIKIEDDARVRALSARFPMVDVARSRPKRELEPPFIGVAVAVAMQRKMDTLEPARPGDRALVLGYGDIGKEVARHAVHAMGHAPDHVHVWDPDATRRAAAQRSGHPVWDRTVPLRFRLVLGCSGRASFTVDDHAYLHDGAVLASASSGTVELSRQHFIELADRYPDDDIWIERDGLDQGNVHSDLRFHFHDRWATFLNAGFPVNFDGRVNCIPDHYIQPTTTMMCAAAVQAAQEQRTGVLPLDDDFSTTLIRDFRALLGDEANWLGAVRA